MNKLTKEMRDRLILVSMGTLAALILIGYLLIQPAYNRTSRINAQNNRARNTLQSMEDGIKNADTIAAEAMDLSYTLSHTEGDMVSGDPNAWVYDTIRNFKGRYKVDISVNGQPSTGDVDFLPRFPYKQLRVAVNGTAYYHDLGTFIADFENTFPHARIVNLNLEPAGSAGDNVEKLTFSMDIIALVNPNGPQS